MSEGAALGFLLLAALFEAGGDAAMRKGIHSVHPGMRWGWMVCGAIMLAAYGYTVNAPRWDFGRLLGVYVVLFFLIAQLISWFVFGQRPGTALLIGGVLIMAGGVVIATHS